MASLLHRRTALCQDYPVSSSVNFRTCRARAEIGAVVVCPTDGAAGRWRRDLFAAPQERSRLIRSRLYPPSDHLGHEGEPCLEHEPEQEL